MKKIIFYFLFFNSSFFCQAQFSSPSTQDSLRGYLSNYRSCYDVFYYDLYVRLHIEQQRIEGFNAIHYSSRENFSQLQLDLSERLSIFKIVDNRQQPLSYKRTGNALFVSFPTQQFKGDTGSVVVYYNGSPEIARKPPWDGGLVWAKDSLNRPWVSVACEGIGASIWWPCKDHLSDEPDSMSMRFEVPQPLFCASNGNLIASTPTNHATTIYHWKVKNPINTYNVNFTAGNLLSISDSFLQKNGSSLALDYYVLSYNKDKAQKHFEQVKIILEHFEKLFGPYPFQKDGYALIETPYWGMEHQSGIAYGNNYKNTVLGFDYILLHETGHEWWGNSMSTKDHGEMWLHESFTTYAEVLFFESIYDKKIAFNYLSNYKKPIKNKEPIEGPMNINYHGWKDSDMYFKGAWILHTLRSSLQNDSLWFELLLQMQKQFYHTQVNSRDIIQFINRKTCNDYTAFFNQYLCTTELPVLEYSIRKKLNNSIVLAYRWNSTVEDFYLPVEVLLNNTYAIQINPKATISELELPFSSEIKVESLTAENFYISIKELKNRTLRGKSKRLIPQRQF